MQQRRFTPVIILSVIVISGALGYFAYTKGFLNSFMSRQAPLSTFIKNLKGILFPTTSPTAGWNIYYEPSGIYSISFPTYFTQKVYPRGESQYLSLVYKEEPTPPVSKFDGENALYIEVYLNVDKNKTTLEIAQENLKSKSLIPNRYKSSELTETTFSGTKSYQFTSNNGRDYRRDIFIGLDNSITIQISYMTRGSEAFRREYIKIAEQIFSTFRFTK